MAHKHLYIGMDTFRGIVDATKGNPAKRQIESAVPEGKMYTWATSLKKEAREYANLRANTWMIDEKGNSKKVLPRKLFEPRKVQSYKPDFEKMIESKDSRILTSPDKMIERPKMPWTRRQGYVAEVSSEGFKKGHTPTYFKKAGPSKVERGYWTKYSRKEVPITKSELAAGAIISGAIAYGGYRAYRHYKSNYPDSPANTRNQLSEARTNGRVGKKPSSPFYFRTVRGKRQRVRKGRRR